MKKILILGGGGFIGGHLSKKLFNEEDAEKIRLINLIVEKLSNLIA